MPKPVRRKKRFIDPKQDNVTTFRLVHRGQRDPLKADNEAPQHVLQEVKQRQREEQVKFGVYFDDEYDYLQHLKERSEMEQVELIPANNDPDLDLKKKEDKKEKQLKLPSSVFQTDVEEKIGLLNNIGLNQDSMNCTFRGQTAKFPVLLLRGLRFP